METLIKLFAFLSHEGVVGTPNGEEVAARLQRHVSENSNLRLQIINLRADPRAYHVHAISHTPVIRLYRHGRQVDSPEDLALVPDELVIWVQRRPNKWDLEKNGLEPGLPLDEIEFEMFEGWTTSALEAVARRIEEERRRKGEVER